MQSTAFVSSWITPHRRNFDFGNANRAPCPLTPSMTLLSHEKLEVLSKSTDVEVAKHRLEIEIPGKFSKERRRQSIQGMKQHANFPGFRKGTIPPYVMKDIDEFIFRDCSNDMIEDALRELDLSKIDGDEGEPEMDLEELSKSFKSGETFSFTCEIQTREVVAEEPAEDLEDVVATDADAEIKNVEMFKDREEKAATA